MGLLWNENPEFGDLDSLVTETKLTGWTVGQDIHLVFHTLCPDISPFFRWARDLGLRRPDSRLPQGSPFWDPPGTDVLHVSWDSSPLNGSLRLSCPRRGACRSDRWALSSLSLGVARLQFHTPRPSLVRVKRSPVDRTHRGCWCPRGVAAIVRYSRSGSCAGRVGPVLNFSTQDLVEGCGSRLVWS